ncbi:MAG: hypothetical protein AABZ30_14960, partial [Myxococcota bacterium]
EAEAESEPVACMPKEASCATDVDLACDPACQTGCATGEKCTLVGAGMLDCVEEGEFAACAEGCSEAADDCEAGALCLAEGSATRCARYCWDDEDCPSGELCNLAVDPTFDPDITVCSTVEGCAPLAAASGCGDGEGCYVVGGECPDGASTGTSVTDCVVITGEAVAGEDCCFLNECPSGHSCVAGGTPGACTGGGDAGICAPLCDGETAGTDDDCSGGATCLLFTYDCPEGGVEEALMDYGVCI